MVDREMRAGDVILFRGPAFEHVEPGKIVVVEQTGEDEGWGA
jgi:hypothetical protein